MGTTFKKTKILAFGTENDPLAWQVADMLKRTPELANADLIKAGSPDDIMGFLEAGNRPGELIIMDAVRGIEIPTVLSIDDLKDRQAVTTHDIDLGLTLKLLNRTGRLRGIDVRIIGIPMASEVSEGLIKRVVTILRELTQN